MFGQAAPASGSQNQSASQEQAIQLEAFVSTGTRFNDRTVTDSVVPIDVLTPGDIRDNGYTELGQVLQVEVPSIDFPRPTITDGTDHIRPVTLRGLSPDQTLVLINGKRRHTSALVNLNGSVGRGSSAVDMNAIPTAAIGSIEVLRDGAAAQYGSDAIAGVVNIFLRKNAGAEFTTTVGQTYANDGSIVEGAFNGGTKLGDKGFLNATVYGRTRGATNRAGVDGRQQYFGINPFTGAQTTLASSGAFNDYGTSTSSGVTLPNLQDPREAGANRRDNIQGDPRSQEGGLFLNSEIPLDNDLSGYAFGGYTYRNSLSAANFRRPADNNNIRAIFPNGFLPKIHAKIYDGSLSAGVDGNASEWKWGLSETYGFDVVKYYTESSVNASYGLASPTNFYDGDMKFQQATTNFDISRSFNGVLATPLKFAAGAEYRWEDYQIKAGDTASWANGGAKILDGPNANSASTLPAAGAQGFPGFRPTDATDKSRSNYAGYLDFENAPMEKLDFDLSVRAEHYDDAGSTVDGKFAGRWEFMKGLAARASVSTGFRAPALAQDYFTTTSTNFINGVPFDIKTFQVTDPAARALGATDLKPEKSVNYSGGFTYAPGNGFSASADYYYIQIHDRIVLSSNFTGTAVTNFLTSIGIPGIGGGRYFTNAVDTRTAGLDVTARYNFKFVNGDSLSLTGGANYNQTKVTHIKGTPANVLALSGGTPIFDRQSQYRFEQGTPRNTYTFGETYKLGKTWAFTFREIRYGQVLSAGTTATLDQVLTPKWLCDVEAAYNIGKTITVAIGANNVFDVYPDKLNALNNISGISQYSSFAPEGFNGGFYYSRVTVRF